MLYLFGKHAVNMYLFGKQDPYQKHTQAQCKKRAAGAAGGECNQTWAWTKKLNQAQKPISRPLALQ